MRYDNYGPAVNAVLDLARAARRISKSFEKKPTYGDLVQHLERPATECWWDLIAIILDYEDAAGKRGGGSRLIAAERSTLMDAAEIILKGNGWRVEYHRDGKVVRLIDAAAL